MIKFTVHYFFSLDFSFLLSKNSMLFL